MSVPTVFISYSHQDEAWNKRLLPQLRALDTAGVGMQVWHDRKIDAGEKWYPEIQDAMANATAAILLISSDFLASPFCVYEEVPALLKRQEETGMLLIPVLLRQCAWRAHRWLKDRQMTPRDGKCVAIDFAGDHSDTVFAAVAEQVLAHFEQLVTRRAAVDLVLESVQLTARGTVAPEPSIIPPIPIVPWPALPVECIDLTRLPETGSALFGRNQELEILDDAWTSHEQARADSVRILVLTSHGGVGKSTLVNHWLAEMARDHFRGATLVFGWSFHNQGVRSDVVASADTFIDAALRFFGDTNVTGGSPWDKGARLAHLVGGQRALLLLDGLEPLQSAHAFERGKLCDPALESLLRGLARRSAGLCIITTREHLTDLAGRPSVLMCDLEQINPQAGRALLRTARVIGTDAELEMLGSRFGPHALAVSLLGVYLREQPGQGIGPARVVEQLPGKEPIDRVLAGFESLLGDSPEREALRLVAFFDGRAEGGCLNALRNSPAISGLTERLVGLDDAEWGLVLDRLHQLRLIYLQRDESGQLCVDSHPLVREHFAARLKGGLAWQAGHRRLYKYLCATNTDKKPEPTLGDLHQLYQAVAHGCQAGMLPEVCDNILWARILRRDKAYSSKKLGAFSSDLGAIAFFFEFPWTQVSSTLNNADKSWILHQAAYRLLAMGQLSTAVDPMQLSGEIDVERKDWVGAATSYSNLSELHLLMGNVAAALRDTGLSLEYAVRSGEWREKMKRLTAHGDALNQAGHFVEAGARFDEAESLQTKNQPSRGLLYSVRGFKYCDLLLTVPERAAWQSVLDLLPSKNQSSLLISCRAVYRRAVQTLEWDKMKSSSLIEIPLDYLTVGRTSLYKAILFGSSLDACVTPLLDAVDGIRRAGRNDYLPRALVSLAYLRGLMGVYIGTDSAQSRLDEAWEIAERGPMPLYMADIHLHRARLFFRDANYPWESPQKDLAEARRLIEKCGYWRRKEELEDAELAILGKSAK